MAGIPSSGGSKRKRLVYLALGAVAFVGVAAGFGYWYLQATSVTEILPSEEFEVDTRFQPDESAWSSWRGRYSDGTDRLETREFQCTSADDAIAFLPIPGRGHSTPIEFGETLVFTTALDDQESQQVVCATRDCSKVLWTREVHQGEFPEIHEDNSHASSSVATDGRHLFAAFLNGNRVMVSCLSADGEIVWQEEAGPYYPEWGFGSTPLVYGGLVLVCGENAAEGVEQIRTTGFLCAMNAQDGSIVWRVKRRHRSYGTPCLVTVNGQVQMVIASTETVEGYNVQSGELIWTARWGAGRTANAVCPYKDSVIASCASLGSRETIRVRVDGTGDVTDSHIVWQYTKNPSDVPSAVVCNELVVFVSDKGLATCLDAETGESLWQLRLGGKFYSSPVVAGERAYVVNRSGQLFSFLVTRDKPDVESHEIAGEVYSSPVILRDRMVLRTTQGLYLFESRKPVAEQAALIKESEDVLTGR